MKNLSQIREVSTLSFNERVLQEAEDRRNPPLERLRFLGIYSSNMDEFYKVRVASIQRRIDIGKKGMAKVLEAIGDKTRELDDRFQDAYADITQTLAKEGIRLLTEKDVDSVEGAAEWLKGYFHDNVLHNLVPILIRKDKPFPQLVDGALYFGVKMWAEKPRYAILEIPPELPRFVQLPSIDIMYVDDVIRYFLQEVFSIFQYDRMEAFEFKVSRDAELDIDNDFSESFIRKMERSLKKRKGGRPTRLVYDDEMPPGLLDVLRTELDITEDDTLIPGGRYHNMKDLMRFPGRRQDLEFEKRTPAKHPVLENLRGPLMDAITKQDFLVTYPYQSFDHVVRLLREAAIDPDVEAIWMTLYRAARNSQVVNALYNAARNGKRICVSVELQARFDEANNIRIAEKLQEVGATVMYGVPPLKVHSKLFLIKKKGLMIAGLSTGNFNEVTADVYVDSCLLTADKRLTVEVERVFSFLEEASRIRTLTQPKFKHLLVSPFNARKTILKHLAMEKEKGDKGYVLLKVNHLTDDVVIKRVEEAANAGVRMDLIVRTTYAMLPHPNIRAISILDRYLEHQRVYMFGRGSDRRVFMSSADLMERNLDWRVEVAFPVYDHRLKQQVADIMELQVVDNFKARVLDETQSNQYVGNGKTGNRTQYRTYEYFCQLTAEKPVAGHEISGSGKP